MSHPPEPDQPAESLTQAQTAETPPKGRAEPRPWLRAVVTIVVSLFILAAILVVVRPMVMEFVQPPPRVLAPPPGLAVNPAVAPAAAAPRPPPNDARLTKAFGVGAINNANRDVTRLAAIAADTLACRLRDHGWVGELRAAAVADVVRRTPSYDSTQDDLAQLRRVLADRFTAGQQARAQEAVSDRAQFCADLPALQDFRAADLLVRTQRAGPR